jgi:hypothetical protein
VDSFQFDGLQFYEIFNQCLHLCQEGYGIGLVKRKWVASIPREWDCDN